MKEVLFPEADVISMANFIVHDWYDYDDGYNGFGYSSNRGYICDRCYNGKRVYKLEDVTHHPDCAYLIAKNILTKYREPK